MSDAAIESRAKEGIAATGGVILDAVGKRFGTVDVLRGVSARIEPGRLTGLVGPDGAGKTTLIRMMAGLMVPTEGRITTAGFDVAAEDPGLSDHIGYMPQRFGLYEDLTVQENLALYASLRNIPAGDRRTLFDRLLDFTRLGPFTGRLAGNLSGGMKQKLGLACALMGTPDVLLLDEPGVGVDPVSRQDLWAMVQALTDDGMAVVWSTAYLDEAERCDTVLLLSEGELIFDGPPDDLTNRLSGRTYHLRGVTENRRGLLTRALDLPTVADGTIQGHAVRLVGRDGVSADALEDFASAEGADLAAVPPRFEDAFVDLLGGGPGGRSVLAERMEPVESVSDVSVSCNDLTKRFGSFTATDTVSFDVRRGEVFGLLGPNGAGKSTTFKMLCGLLKPTSGRATVTGLDLRRATSAAKTQLGYMAQKFSLYGLLNVRQNLDFFAGIYGLPGSVRHDRIEEMVETFQLGPFLDAAPGDLSLGYKQRLALACSLMHRPPVLFLDEPTSGVDPITRREFWTHINGLVGKGVTVLVTTHFMDEAEYCDRVALMYKARLIALDTPDALKRQAATEEKPDPTMEEAFIRLIEQEDANG
ncbi:ABC transporter ATP-binding protein [Rhodospirillaceae bacterium KN72]|uniref:ABC transporter ATP-binding protein n=1 Tax=Pacificispira spongiicola TaxID=2729598 RepID=A0A7Y0E1T8_9PROT|nr:ATP-binding cassette domain-containing protein [Pacificispira spongiicola]NMM45660.1 ABC transporter ATP-binding protein [Pacificispira spongiicola]